MNKFIIHSSPHYVVHDQIPAEQGMSILRMLFPTATANEMNLTMFSTNGIHGSPVSLERVEHDVLLPESAFEDLDERYTELTFVVVKPRMVTLHYGNCQPKTPDDFAFLKHLRATSLQAFTQMSLPNPLETMPSEAPLFINHL